MSDFEEAVVCYRRLELESISSEWAERIWDGNFCEDVGEIPEVVVNHLDQLSCIVKATRKWIKKRKENNNKSEQCYNNIVCVRVENMWLKFAVKGTSTGVVNDSSEEGPGFWSVLCEAHVSHRTLLAVIYALLDRIKLVCCIIKITNAQIESC